MGRRTRARGMRRISAGARIGNGAPGARRIEKNLRVSSPVGENAIWAPLSAREWWPPMRIRLAVIILNQLREGDTSRRDGALVSFCARVGRPGPVTRPYTVVHPFPYYGYIETCASRGRAIALRYLSL